MAPSAGPGSNPSWFNRVWIALIWSLLTDDCGGADAVCGSGAAGARVAVAGVGARGIFWEMKCDIRAFAPARSSGVSCAAI